MSNRNPQDELTGLDGRPMTPRRKSWLSPLNQRRWQNFKANRRAFWSLIILTSIYVITLFGPLLANDRPLLVRYQGETYVPLTTFYPETTFGGDFRTEAVYRDIEVQCLIISGGLDACWDAPSEVIDEVQQTGAFEGEPVEKGWLLWPPIPHSFETIVDGRGVAPAPPNVIGSWTETEVNDDGTTEEVSRFGLLPSEIRGTNLLGTDDTSRDVLARVIYGFELSVTFTLIVTFCTSVLGIFMGAIQGYYGGVIDLIWQRIIEIWNATPSLYVIIIISAILAMNFWLLVGLLVLFGWTALVGLVRAEFLRARNFEYVRAARALGVSNFKIMFRHVLPNAMVATLTFVPFGITGNIAALASLDFLGFGLPAAYPSLGEMTLQAKNNLQAPWLGFTAFFTFAFMLSLLVFIFEGVRDAFDPRKTFS